MPRPLAPHPDFPPGTPVRIKTLGCGATPNRQRLAGCVGTVYSSSKSIVLVAFPGMKFREHFRPEQLDRAAAPPG